MDDLSPALLSVKAMLQIQASSSQTVCGTLTSYSLTSDLQALAPPSSAAPGRPATQSSEILTLSDVPV